MDKTVFGDQYTYNSVKAELGNCSSRVQIMVNLQSAMSTFFFGSF